MNDLLFKYIIFILILNFIGSYLHTKYYQNTLYKVQKEYDSGYMGVGITQGQFKPKKVLILIVDEKNIILDCKVLNGLSVFSKFKSLSEFKNMNYKELPKELLEKKKYKETLKQAIDLINRKQAEGY